MIGTADTSTDWASDHLANSPPGGGGGYSYGTMKVGRRRVPKRVFYQQILEQMRAQRASWDPLWQDIADVTDPRRVRFDRAAINRTERNTKIKNGRATIATDRLVALMFSKLCSPSDIWFTGEVGTPEDMKDEEVQTWVAGEMDGIRQTLEDGECYRVLEPVIRDIVNPATGGMFVEDDLETVVRAYHMPVGSYFIANSGRGVVDTVIRECSMTTAALEDKFGFDALSDNTKRALDRGDLTSYVPIVHAVSPNGDYTPGVRIPKALSKKWTSCWFEVDGKENADQLLGEDVYDDFPAIIGRWGVIGEDVWGSGSPGMAMVPDGRELQENTIDAAVVRAMISQPPMGIPASMVGDNFSIIPGAINYLDNAAMDMKAHRLVDTDGAQLQAIYAGEERLEGRIGEAYFAALWKLLEDEGDAGTRRTATEIHELRSEKYSLLGPLANHLHADVLKPLVMRVWNARLRAGKVKPWPRRLIGKTLKLEFRSEFSQAQKGVKALALSRLTEQVGMLVQVTGDPTVAYNINPQAIINLHADALGADPTATRPPDEVEKLLQAAAKRQQQAEEEAQAGQRADTLQKLGTPMDDDSIGAQLGNAVQPQMRGAA